MNVLLVNPPRFKEIPVIREERCEITDRYSVLPPYSLLQIASLLRRDGHEVTLIDANGQHISYDEVKKRIEKMDYDALIFRFTPTTFDWDMKLTEISKELKSEAKTIGICWTLRNVPEEVLKEARCLDVYVRHEYEVVVPSLVDSLQDLSKVEGIAYKEGSVKVTSPAEPLKDYDSIPVPSYDLLPSLKNYFINTPHGSPFTIMYTSKGCPFGCIYCTVANTKLRKRSADNVLEELRYLKTEFNVKTVTFFDETFTIDTERVTEICDGIKEENLDIKWYCNSRVDLVDKELLKKMYEGGCRGIAYGIESGSQEILDNAKKGTTVQQGENAIKWGKEAGIKVYCSFMFGLPGENWCTIKKTIEFVDRTLPTGAQFNVTVPYPGTELYEIARKKEWIRREVNWREMYQHRAILRTAELDCNDLNKARIMAYKALYFNLSWWLQNMKHVVKHPDDFRLAARYSGKIIKNYLLHGMQHAH